MDAAGSNTIRTAVTQHGPLLGQHEVRLTNTTREVEFLVNQVVELTALFQDLQRMAAQGGLGRPHPCHEPEPCCNNPPPYKGDPNSCRAFLSQCAAVFTLQPQTYASKESKVVFVLTLLISKARDWGPLVWETRAPCCASFKDLEMVRLFDRLVRGQEAADQLAHLRQAGHSVTKYAISFKTLVASCDWNEDSAGVTG